MILMTIALIIIVLLLVTMMVHLEHLELLRKAKSLKFLTEPMIISGRNKFYQLQDLYSPNT